MKFYATQPSRARLEEDVLAFVSLLRGQRDEQAERMVRSTVGKPAAAALHEALAARGALAELDDRTLEGAWREKLEDPQDLYAPSDVRKVEFAMKGKDPLGATYHVWWGGRPAGVVGRFAVEPKGAGFTLAFSGFGDAEPARAASPAAAAPPKAAPKRAAPRK